MDKLQIFTFFSLAISCQMAFKIDACSYWVDSSKSESHKPVIVHSAKMQSLVLMWIISNFLNTKYIFHMYVLWIPKVTFTGSTANEEGFTDHMACWGSEGWAGFRSDCSSG